MTAPTTKREKKTSFCSNTTETALLYENDDQTSTNPSTLYPRRRYSSTSSWSSYSQGLKRCEDNIAGFQRLKFWFVVACIINVFLMTGIIAILCLYVQEIIKVFNVDTTATTVGPTLPQQSTKSPESDIRTYLNCSSKHDGYYEQCYLSDLAEEIQKSIEDVRLSKALENCARRPNIHVQKGELSKSHSNDLHVMKWRDVDQHYGFDPKTLTTEGTIKIEEDGFYFLYTQVHFVVNAAQVVSLNKSSSNTSGMHIVQKRGSHDDKFNDVINSTFQCFLEDNLLQQQHTSSLKRIVQAKQNEEIRVVVKYPIKQFQTKPLQNYFGLFKLC